MERFVVIGPPGTGKTTYVAKQCANAVAKYGSDAVLVCSLTRAAASEAAGRDTGLRKEMVGTLHSHCYHALGRPEIVDRKHLASWNEEHPAWSLSGVVAEDEDAPGGASEGDELMQQVDVLRARMAPVETWPARARRFFESWTEWKGELGLSDFTDLIERAHTDLPLPPHRPSVVFADEAQDLSRLEVSLLYRWMPHVESVVLVGDGDQALYGWRGADPDVLGGTVHKVLEQSWRVPRQVHAAARRLILQAQHRQDASYLPSEDEGVVERHPSGFRDFEDYLPLVEEVLARGERLMILAACDYMLDGAKRALRAEGIPYGNPYSARWNPLRPSTGVSAGQRMLAFLAGKEAGWRSAVDLKRWVHLLSAKETMRRGGKSRVESLPDDATVPEVLQATREAFVPDVVPALLDGDLDWLQAHALASHQQSLRYPAAVYRRYGEEGLTSDPRVILGTIHSVKGGEAENVLVFPDLSPSGYEQYQQSGWYHRDAIIRLFYVAFTRARRRLIIAEPSGGMYADL